MTWPAPDLPFAFQNATISADTHPNAHNETNVSLNDNYRPEIIRLGSIVDDLLPLPISKSAGTGVADIGSTPVVLTAVSASVTLVAGQTYALTAWCPIRYGIGSPTVFVDMVLRSDQNLLLGLQDYSDKISNERWTMTGEVLYTAPDALPHDITLDLSTTDGTTLQTNSNSLRNYGWQFTPVIVPV